MDSGPSGNTTTTQKSAPWDAQQPYLTDLFSKAQNLENSGGPQYYQGNQVAGFSPAQQQAQQMVMNRATQGSPVNTAASNYTSDLLSGKYLNSNPYLDGMYNSAASAVTRNYQNAVQPGISSGFEAAGRFGSGASQNAQSQAQLDLGQSLGNMASNIYGNNYNNVMGQMTGALSQAPTIANQGYTDANMLNQFGGQQQAQNQNAINADMNKWNYNQNLPYQNLQRYQGLIGGNYGMDGTTTQPYYTNPMGNLLGAGMGVAGMGNMMGLWGGKAGMGILSGLL